MRHGVLKKLIPIVLLLLSGAATYAQDSIVLQKSKPTFHVNAAAGLLVGANGRDVQVQLMPGVQYKNWDAGIGAGLEYYYWRGVPLFVGVQHFFQKPMPVFLYTNVGWHLPWVQDKYKTTFGYKSDFQTGLYYDAGAGWYTKLNQRHALQVSVGYSGKNVTDVQQSLFMPPGTDARYYTQTYDYTLRRISLKVGFQF